jgi:hypothetical protein
MGIRIKLDAKGKFEKYKCRVVVIGYSQIAGLDLSSLFKQNTLGMKGDQADRADLGI